MGRATEPLAQGSRFQFGNNWSRYLAVIDEGRVGEAENSLTSMLDSSDLTGKTFLDIGCGSGLFSLAARRLGARVKSFDCDPTSVACAIELKRRYYPLDNDGWSVEHGSVLSGDYLATLGKYDVVYAWGVLHHTGHMWQALENVIATVADSGRLFVSIYNDQGSISRRWRKVKLCYNRCPPLIRPVLVLSVGAFQEAWWALKEAIRLRNPIPFKNWAAYRQSRGMSYWHDLVDWVGGYPFEVAMPEDIFDFYHQRGFVLRKLKTRGGGHGCNEFVFQKITHEWQ
jgi:SAM-dependent methyltransferase